MRIVDIQTGTVSPEQYVNRMRAFLRADTPPAPLDVGPPTPETDQQEVIRTLESANYQQIAEAWLRPGFFNSAESRQRANLILARPDGFKLPFPHPPESQKDFLEIVSNLDPEHRPLHEILLDTCYRHHASDMMETIPYLFSLVTAIDPSEKRLIELQRQYQPLVFELLHLSNKNLDRLSSFYPTFSSLAVRKGSADSDAEPTIQILKADISYLIQKKVLGEWTTAISPPQEAAEPALHQANRARRLLIDFMSSWAPEPKARSHFINTMLCALEQRAETYDEGPYCKPEDIMAIAGHITDDQTLFSFLKRHHMPNSPELLPIRKGTEYEAEDKEIVEWFRNCLEIGSRITLREGLRVLKEDAVELIGRLASRASKSGHGRRTTQT